MTLLMVARRLLRPTRAIETASTRWLVLAGAASASRFLAKGLQPFTVLPALALAYLVAAPTVAGAGGCCNCSPPAPRSSSAPAGGCWPSQLTPAGRPSVHRRLGRTTRALGLAFGYNGLSRLSGSSAQRRRRGGGGFDGDDRPRPAVQLAQRRPDRLAAAGRAGRDRRAWPWLTRRAPRTDRTRAALIIWGGWLLVTGAVLSFASGIIHTYYTVELAPAIAALVAIGTVVLWRSRHDAFARVALAAGAVVSGVWSYALLHRTPSFHPWLAYVLLIAAAPSAAALLVRPGVLGRGAVVATTAAGLVVLGGGSAAYALDTASTAHTGSTPSAGPTATRRLRRSAAAGFGPRGTGGGRGRFPGGGTRRPGARGRTGGGGFPGGRPAAPLRRRSDRRAPAAARPAAAPGAGAAAAGAVSSALTDAAEDDDTRPGPRRRSARSPPARSSWPAARRSCRSAGSTAATPRPRWPSSSSYVQQGKIAYFIGGGGFGGGRQRQGSTRDHATGSPRTTPRRRSATRPSTTCRRHRHDHHGRTVDPSASSAPRPLPR